MSSRDSLTKHSGVRLFTSKLLSGATHVARSPELKSGSKIFFLAAVFFSACADPEVPVVEVEAVYPKVDSLAVYLKENRWPCSGLGCATDGAIVRIADEIRWASSAYGIPIPTLVGVLMVENPWLDTTAVSHAGAAGLYQVMPMHEGLWQQCQQPMKSISGSVCYGSAILSDFISSKGDERSALLAYNGCRSSFCEGYPNKVSHYSNDFSSLQ